MKQMVPALSPLLRSNTQGDILAALFLDTGREWTVADIARQVDSPYSLVHREVLRLVHGGIARDRRVGRARLVQANENYALVAPLQQIVLATYGPRAVLGQELQGVAGIEQALIYGSWAARYAGEEGTPPRDIDVLLVGTTPRKLLEQIAQTAGNRLAQEVNITRVSPEIWASTTDLFIKTIRERPHVEIPMVNTLGRVA